MSILKSYFRGLILSTLIIVPAISFAVSQKEMEQARVIAAKWYIRYVNDGSGYLDDINPTTMEELQNALKPKEKENIKAFLAIPVPSDYQTWDKQKLVDYWAGTAFQDKGLVEKGRGGRLKARNLINKMTISDHQQAETTPQTSEPAVTNGVQINENAADVNSQASEEIQNEISETEQTIEEEIFEDSQDINIEKQNSYTWVYILCLAILVAIVLALIVYAANILKKKDNNQQDSSETHLNNDVEIIEKYEAAIADKDVEIAMLTKKLETATRQNTELKTKIEALTSELSNLRGASHERFMPQNKYEPAREKVEEKPRESELHNSSANINKGTLRSIFLGRANAKNIFVRADRTLNPGHSIFILDTSDGFTGSFRVADSPEAWKLALSNPKEYLMNACVGHDLEDTIGVSRIGTEDSGTAVFEGGCWRVIRKAKIRYE